MTTRTPDNERDRETALEIVVQMEPEFLKVRLVALSTLQDLITAALTAVRQGEREACARIALDTKWGGEFDLREAIAEAIRTQSAPTPADKD